MTAHNNMSPNGPLYTRFGRASASPNLAEWSERMRAERGPMSTQILGFQIIVRRAPYRLLAAGFGPHFHKSILFLCAERPEGKAQSTIPILLFHVAKITNTFYMPIHYFYSTLLIHYRFSFYSRFLIK
jgi:hypothetical protein